MNRDKLLLKTVGGVAIFAFLVSCAPLVLAGEFLAKPIYTRSAKAKSHDQEIRKKLEAMSPREVAALDRKLAKALELFYEHEYTKALPLFQEIAEQAETMDVKFWLGICALRAGEIDLAITKFQQMLALDPGLHRVRLELATAYYRAGRYLKARKELNTVLASNPPESVKKNIERLLSKISEKTGRVYPALRLGVGLQHDSNVSAGPEDELIRTPVGGQIQLRDTQKEVSDWVGVIHMAGRLLYDVPGPNGFMINTAASLYQTHNLDHHKFDFTYFQVTAAPWWVAKRVILKMPVGFGKAIYGHESLYGRTLFTPSIEYFFTKSLSFTGGFAYLDDEYDPPERKGQTNINRIWTIGPKLYLNGKSQVLSLFYSKEDLKAEDNGYSYDGFNIGGSLFLRLPWQLECYLRYVYSKREHDGQPLPARRFGWSYDREDKRHNLYIGLTKGLWKQVFGTVYFNWLDNDSNTELYEFNKTIYGFSIGVRF